MPAASPLAPTPDGKRAAVHVPPLWASTDPPEHAGPGQETTAPTKSQGVTDSISIISG
jgi:hypothetical protein